MTTSAMTKRTTKKKARRAPRLLTLRISPELAADLDTWRRRRRRSREHAALELLRIGAAAVRAWEHEDAPL